ncbi:MAG: bifunctional riboflavin kinase/FAD synthetase [Clostridia bacterium]|nr:bifunctional riboflavin kinase/FAD synthetase [Clostridia bacterium]
MTVYNCHFTELNNPSAVALVYFDGVHIGHKAVISSAREYAEEKKINTVIWTFENSPKSVFDKKKLSDEDEKKRIFESLGTDVLITFPFDESVRKLECEEFVIKVLKRCLKAKKVFCGFNYTFGAGGKGDPEALKALCEKHGIETEIIPPVLLDGAPVSSSRIRSLIEEGDIENANRLLGRPYCLQGEVIDGKKLGRTIGFPTANTLIPENMTVPKDGVYLTKTIFNGNEYYGITDIGTKPTVGTHRRGAETYIFDFEENIYGRIIRTEFLKYLRGEKRFETLDELIAQITTDSEYAKKIINER